MMLPSTNPGHVIAFVKRRSSVQARLAALLFPRDSQSRPSPSSPRRGCKTRVSGTGSVHGPRPYGRRPEGGALVSHVVRTCCVCEQRFVGGRSSLTCSRSCDARASKASASPIERAVAAKLAIVPEPPPTLPAIPDPPASERLVDARRRASTALADLRAAIRASVQRQLAEGRDIAARQRSEAS